MWNKDIKKISNYFNILYYNVYLENNLFILCKLYELNPELILYIYDVHTISYMHTNLGY